MVSCLGILEVSAFQRCSLIEDLDFSLTSNVENISPDYATNTAQGLWPCIQVNLTCNVNNGLYVKECELNHGPDHNI